MTHAPTSKLRLFFIALLIVILALVGIGVLGYWGFKGTPSEQTDQDAPPKVYEPVVYDVASWQASQKRKTLNDKELLSILGANASIDSTLDFHGKKADEYHFTSLTEPMLSAVISDKLFEVHWYQASAQDTDSDKAVSVGYAKRTYQLLTAIYGADTRGLMQALLDGKTLPKQQGVTFAECQMYRCQVVLDRAVLGIKTSKTTKTDTKD